MADMRLVIPPELLTVPQDVLKEFLAEFAQRVISKLAPNISEDAAHSAFSAVYACITIGGAPCSSNTLRLELRHACKFSGCTSHGCELCRNNPHKVCDHAYCLDQQYWVRDDGKGGQLIKAKCGADIELQLFRGMDPQPLLKPDVKVKLYVAGGHLPAPPTLLEPAGGFYMSDEGRPLFFANGLSPEDDGGLPLELVQDGALGAGWVVPELQFLDKNSKFRALGRPVKSFRFLARAIARDPITGVDTVLAQTESEPFKVTTKKGYDGCRKAEHLFAHEAVTDKTFANLGETTINNLKATFMGVETVEDLKQLVERCGADPELEEQVREVLNMSRDKERWRKFSRTLRDKVLYEDSAPRLWWLPAAPAAGAPPGLGGRGVGLLWQTHKGQLEFSTPAGVVTQDPVPGAPLRVAHITGASQAVAGAQLLQLQQLAVHSWRLRRHPGWRPVREDLEWINADPQQLLAAAAGALSGYPEPMARLVAGQSASSSHPFSSGSGSSAASHDNNSSMANTVSVWGPAAAGAAAAGESGRGLSVVVPQLPQLVSSRGSGGPVSPFMTSTPPADLGWPTTSMPPRPAPVASPAAGRGTVVGPVWGGLPGRGPPPLPVPGVPFQGGPAAGRGRPSPVAAGPGRGGGPPRPNRSVSLPPRHQQQGAVADQGWQQPMVPASSPLGGAGGSYRESPFSRPLLQPQQQQPMAMPGIPVVGPRSPLQQQQQQQQQPDLLDTLVGMGLHSPSWAPVQGGLIVPVTHPGDPQQLQVALPHTQQQQQQQPQALGLSPGTSSMPPAAPPTPAAAGFGFLGPGGQAAALAAIDAAVASCPREVPPAVLQVRRALQERWPMAQVHELLRSFSDGDLALLLNVIKGAHQHHQQHRQQPPAAGAGVGMAPGSSAMSFAPDQLTVSAAGPWPQQQAAVSPAASTPLNGANAVFTDMVAANQPPGSTAAAAAAGVGGGAPDGGNQLLMDLLLNSSSQGPPVGVLDSFGGNLAPLPDLVADLTQLPGDGPQLMDWIPDLDKVHPPQQQQPQQQQGAGQKAQLGTKRERSSTAAAGERFPSICGLQQLLGGPGSFLGIEDEDLLLLRDSSSGSFGRHMPMARLRSNTGDVTQRPAVTPVGMQQDQARPAPQAAGPLANIPEEGPAAAAATSMVPAALAGGAGGASLGGAWHGVPLDGTASDPLGDLDPAADVTKATLGVLGDLSASARSISRGTGMGAWGLDTLGVGFPAQDDLSSLFIPSAANLGELQTARFSMDSPARSSSSGHLGWFSRLFARSSGSVTVSGSGSKAGLAGSGGSGASVGRTPSSWWPGVPLQ